MSRGWTADEIEQLVADAVTAVREHLGKRPNEQRRARAETRVTLAVLAGVPVTRIAAEVGVSPRLVAPLVTQAEERGKAWQQVRHAGKREAEMAESAFRKAVLADLERLGVDSRGSKTLVCRRFGLHRPQLDRMLEKEPAYR